MTDHKPKELKDKLSDYQKVSFAAWLEKTNVVAQEEGDLNSLSPQILNTLKALANQTNDVTKINLVNAINHSFNETRRTLIKAIAMS